jgi:hypothetical protein|tara:strand:- start:2110 stop:2601 length:492 start_codon:yes stop_codon:yes gene_type:complete
MRVRIGPYRKNRAEKIEIEKFDTWSMDATLALIIHPMLIQLKETTHGAPVVSLEDVPEHLHATEESIAKYLESGESDESFFDRWNYVLDEMIFAFKSKNEDWEQQFYSGEHDMQWIERDDGMGQMVYGPNNTFKVDVERLSAYQDRISNGFRLFGKYYENLWD